VTLVALCVALTVNASILRVSNVSGSTAPYSTVKAALNAAAEGDTIMLDASPTGYSIEFQQQISKRIVLLGPGYWLQSNSIIQEGANSAYLSGSPLTIAASGVVICGIWFSEKLWIDNCNNVVIKRCNIRNGIEMKKNTRNCVLHQNFIRIDDSSNNFSGSFHQFTNNIFISHWQSGYTFLGKGGIRLWDSGDCTVEKNISGKAFYNSGSGVSSLNDNIVIENSYNTYDNNIIDSGVKALDWSTTHGAFAGDSPYVISGLPSAPVIEDMVVPTTVEYGSKMNVTIKVGVQK